jgi:hypothetical protein
VLLEATNMSAPVIKVAAILLRLGSWNKVVAIKHVVNVTMKERPTSGNTSKTP